MEQDEMLLGVAVLFVVAAIGALAGATMWGLPTGAGSAKACSEITRAIDMGDSCEGLKERYTEGDCRIVNSDLHQSEPTVRVVHTLGYKPALLDFSDKTYAQIVCENGMVTEFVFP